MSTRSFARHCGRPGLLAEKGAGWTALPSYRGPRRIRGAAFLLVLGALLVIATIVMALFFHMQGRLREAAFLNDDAHELFVAEAVFANEMNRLKKDSWLNRWYVQGAAGAPPLGALVRGVRHEVTYEATVQDVLNENGETVPGQTDVLIQTEFRDSRRSYLWRVQFRRPSPLRPTAFRTLRFARLAAHEEVATPDGRSEVLARMLGDHRSLASNRPAARVLARSIRHWSRRGLSLADWLRPFRQSPGWLRGTPGEVSPSGGWVQALAGSAARWVARPWLARPAEAAIGEEQRSRGAARPAFQTLDRLVRTEPVADAAMPVLLEYLAEWPSLSGEIASDTVVQANLDVAWAAREDYTQDLAAAITYYDLALAAAVSQGPVNKDENEPRVLYGKAEALCRRASAQSLPGFGSASTRQSLLDQAEAAYQRIATKYPGSREASHCRIPWAWMQLKRVDPASTPSWNGKRQEAKRVLEELRFKYPRHHLWGEEAITSPSKGAQGTFDAEKNEEIVWFEEQLLQPGLVFGTDVERPGGPIQLARMKWDGGSSLVLTAAPGRKWGFQPSPDATEVLYALDSRNDFGYWRVRADGERPFAYYTKLPAGSPGEKYACCRWSPDGSRISMGEKQSAPWYGLLAAHPDDRYDGRYVELDVTQRYDHDWGRHGEHEEIFDWDYRWGVTWHGLHYVPREVPDSRWWQSHFFLSRYDTAAFTEVENGGDPLQLTWFQSVRMSQGAANWQWMLTEYKPPWEPVRTVLLCRQYVGSCSAYDNWMTGGGWFHDVVDGPPGSLIVRTDGTTRFGAQTDLGTQRYGGSALVCPEPGSYENCVPWPPTSVVTSVGSRVDSKGGVFSFEGDYMASVVSAPDGTTDLDRVRFDSGETTHLTLTPAVTERDPQWLPIPVP